MKKNLLELTRPSKRDDLVGNRDQFQMLFDAIDEELRGGKLMPPVLLIGPPGNGKTSAVQVLLHEMGVDQNDAKEINMSLVGGIDTAREQIAPFVSRAPRGKTRKILVLEEYDNASQQNQQALRRMTETSSSHTLFVFTGNYERKIIDPIKDRCMILRLGPVSTPEITKRLEMVCERFEIPYDDADLKILAERARGTMRQAIVGLSFYKKGEPIQTIGDKVKKAAKQFLAVCKSGSINDAGSLVVDVVANLHISERDFLECVLDIVVNAKIPDDIRQEFCIVIGEADFRFVSGAHPKITLMWAISAIQKYLSSRRDKKK